MRMFFRAHLMTGLNFRASGTFQSIISSVAMYMVHPDLTCPAIQLH